MKIKVISSLLVACVIGLTGCASQKGSVADGLSYYDAGDFKNAVSILKGLANDGEAQAQNALGVMYENGQGVQTDYREALKWYGLAAAQDNDSALYHIGMMHANGLGVPQSNAEAVKWFRQAALNGNSNAQYQLGTLAVKGQGIAANPQQAFQWFKQAAAQGDPQAQFQIGSMLANGYGTRQDPILAYMWLDIAQGLDEPAAVQAALLLTDKMTSKDVLTAQKMARQCIKQSYKACDRITR